MRPKPTSFIFILILLLVIPISLLTFVSCGEDSDVPDGVPAINVTYQTETTNADKEIYVVHSMLKAETPTFNFAGFTFTGGAISLYEYYASFDAFTGAFENATKEDWETYRATVWQMAETVFRTERPGLGEAREISKTVYGSNDMQLGSNLGFYDITVNTKVSALRSLVKPYQNTEESTEYVSLPALVERKDGTRYAAILYALTPDGIADDADTVVTVYFGMNRISDFSDETLRIWVLAPGNETKAIAYFDVEHSTLFASELERSYAKIYGDEPFDEKENQPK